MTNRAEVLATAKVEPRQTRFGYFEARAVGAGAAIGTAGSSVSSRWYKVMLDFDLAPSRLFQEPEPETEARDVAPCPVCSQGFLRRHFRMACPRCDREHHLGCWDACGGCAVCDVPRRRRCRRAPILLDPSPRRRVGRERAAICALLSVIAASIWWTASRI